VGETSFVPSPAIENSTKAYAQCVFIVQPSYKHFLMSKFQMVRTFSSQFVFYRDLPCQNNGSQKWKLPWPNHPPFSTYKFNKIAYTVTTQLSLGLRQLRAVKKAQGSACVECGTLNQLLHVSM